MNLPKLPLAFHSYETGSKDSFQASFASAYTAEQMKAYATAAVALAVPVPPTKLDPVVEANRALLHQRSQVGIAKYGVTLAEANLSERALTQHALEEALDLANYLQGMLQRGEAGSQEVLAPLDFVQALGIAQSVFDLYKKEQYVWWRKMDGTPMLNDIAVRMAEAFRDAVSGKPTP